MARRASATASKRTSRSPMSRATRPSSRCRRRRRGGDQSCASARASASRSARSCSWSMARPLRARRRRVPTAPKTRPGGVPMRRGRPQAAQSVADGLCRFARRPPPGRERGHRPRGREGHGTGGRITDEDVERAAGGGTPAARVAPAARPMSRRDRSRRSRVRGIRRRIAEAMATAYRTIPHVSGFHEFDAEALVALHAALQAGCGRARCHAHLPSLHREGGVAGAARAAVPQRLARRGRGAILLKKALNIGLATSAPDGLVVPVIHNADRLGLREIARAIERLSSGARSRTLAPEDLQQGTFTITNVGAQRGWLNTSLIRPPGGSDPRRRPYRRARRRAERPGRRATDSCRWR